MKKLPLFILFLLLSAPVMAGSTENVTVPENASDYINDSSSNLTNVTKDGSSLKPEEGLPLTLILGAFALLVAGGVAVYFKRRKKKTQEKSPGVTAPEEVTTVKSSDSRAFGISHVGGRNNNEDNLLILNLPDAYILAVADGLGGHNAGEVASQIAVDTLKETFEQEYRKGMDYKDVKRLLEKAYRLAHERIRENAVGDREGMGTTLVTAFVRDGKVIVANTGDSRAYLIRGRSIVERTKDHSLVQELVDKGEITPEDAESHPMRNVITRALGLDFGLDFYEWKLRKGDVLLISSDGLHDYVSEERILDVVLSGKRAEEIAKKLVEEALPVTRDNVTVVVWR